MREGEVTLAQAHVIHRALTAFPRRWMPTRSPGPRRTWSSRRLSSGRRSSAGSAAGSSTSSPPRSPRRPRAARLADLEAHADEQTRLTLRRLGDGTTRISGRLPDHVGTRLATYLEAFANPRTHGDRAAGAAEGTEGGDGA